MPSADSRCEVGSPYGLLTRGFCFCRDHLFVLPDLMIGLVRVTARDFPDAKGFFLPVSLIFRWVSVAVDHETQRVSRGKHRLLSAHGRQIYGVWSYDGYRALSCVADSPRPYPASNLPALYPIGYGAYLYVDLRFCFRLPSGLHCCTTLAVSYPSPPSGWGWTLSNTCVISI